ncbi:hypothetical protein P4B09_16255 (plasmid) [Lactiplantibacillus plantarum]
MMFSVVTKYHKGRHSLFLYNSEIFYAFTQDILRSLNFTYSISTLASYVQLTQAEMAVILQKDISGEENQGIVELNENDREKIAKEWLAEIFEVVKS